MAKTLSIIISVFIASMTAAAQTDTLTTNSSKLNITHITEGKKSYAVFFTDSLDNRLTTADIWDRDVKLMVNSKGQKQYDFRWHWYRGDTLLMEADGVFDLPTLKPVSYKIIRKKAKPIDIAFNNNEVVVNTLSAKSKNDTSFHVQLPMAAYAFPMDMELFSLLPIRKVGQKFIIPFYEPGRTTAAWYPVTVTGREELVLTGHVSVKCWTIRIDYTGSTSSATFWITEKDHDLLKMKSCFKGRCRYKVKLY